MGQTFVLPDAEDMAPPEPAAGFGAMGADTPGGQTEILRENPAPPAARAALVKQMQDAVRRDKKHWEKQFKTMREDAQFLRDGADKGWLDAKKYVVNLVLRHTAAKTAALYAKNPAVKVKRREKLMASAWDGSVEQLQMAAMSPGDPQAMMILMDAQKIALRGRMLDGLARSLELVLEHQMSQARPPFKSQMKHLVRRTVGQGVAYVKLGYVREGSLVSDPDTLASIADFASVHATIDRISADMVDKRTTIDDADAERLRLTMGAMQQPEFIMTHEGLTFDFPQSPAIIPDRRMTSLDGFQGCDHVTEEFLLTADKVKEFFGVDPQAMTNCTRYSGAGFETEPSKDKSDENDRLCVWMTYRKTDGLVYWTMDGWHDFLREPAPPEVKLERFWPWFALVFNETEDAQNPFPPSDVSILRSAQLEYNRAREGLREHRIANRPGHVVRDNGLDDDDVTNIVNRKAHDVIRVKGLGQGEAVDNALQAIKGAPIDPAIYDTSGIMDDILRQSGSQDANLGNQGNGTATEASIAENSRISSTESNKDDLDMLMGELFAEAGQILLREMSPDTVKRIAGDGAIWPELSADDVVDEIHATVLAGSSGKPNKMAALENMQRVAPFLLQLPGIKPEFLARKMLERLDDDIDLTEAFADGLPSIAAMNAAGMGGPGGPQGAPAPGEEQGDGRNPPSAQGSQGRQNAPGSGQSSEAQPGRSPGMGSGARPMNGAPGGM